MAVVYPDDIKAARMNAVKNALGVDGTNWRSAQTGDRYYRHGNFDRYGPVGFGRGGFGGGLDDPFGVGF